MFIFCWFSPEYEKLFSYVLKPLYWFEYYIFFKNKWLRE